MAIRVPPSTAGQASVTVFSRPLFHLGDLPPIEGQDVQEEIMLRLNLKPHVLKFLFEGYLWVAELIMWQQLRMGRIGSSSSLAESPRFKTTGTRDDAFPPDMEGVAQSPGLAAILTSQYQVDRPC